MERLTERTTDGILVKEDYGEEVLKNLYQCYGAEPMPHYANCDEGYCAMEKLAEYEDFEEIFRSKMTDAACEFLKDKEEFARWLDRNKWIAKKCDEYARAEEQKKLPVAVGDTVYYRYDGIKIEPMRVKEIIVAKYGIALLLEYCGDDEKLKYWKINIESTAIDCKILFLTKESAEAALKEMSE